MRIRLIALAFALLPCSPAAAAGVPTLKAEITVTGDIVKIGDLIADAGSYAGIAVFRAPDPGEIGAVQTVHVLEAVRRHGLVAVDTGGLAEVVVTRLGRTVSIGEIENAVVQTLAGQRGLGPAKNLTITFDRNIRPLQVDADAGELRAAYGNYDPYTGRFDVSFSVGRDPSFKRAHLRYTGTVVETVEVATLMRAVARGDVIRSADVSIERKPKAQVPAGAVDHASQIVGMAARKALQPSQPIRAADLMKPELVRQNESVTVTYEVRGLILSVRGKAMEAGAEGDVVNVLNVQSKRTMQGVVIGPGRVSIMVPASPILTASGNAGSETTGFIAAVAPQQRSE